MPVGFVNAGILTVSGEFWDADPFLGGNFVSLGLDPSATYSATVVAGAVTPVPEPSTLLLMASGVTGLPWRRCRSSKHDASKIKRLE